VAPANSREERLQKILSAAGIASRRHAEQMIMEGRITVNGQIVAELGSKADAERDHIKVDGKLIHMPDRHVYLALNKPDCVMSTVHDPERRTTVIDLLHGVKQRVYPVGRLDYHSQGLLLLTNDGDFANLITAAKSHVAKTYLVKINGPLSEEDEEKFRHGVPVSGKRTAPAGLKLVRKGDNPWYEVRLIEGRNQQIRIMFRHFGRLVEKLKRIQIGSLELGSLKPGEFRHLAPDEVARLTRVAKGLERRREIGREDRSGRSVREDRLNNDRRRKTAR
jgi:23S rRNA pseudouridine2605 synthase